MHDIRLREIPPGTSYAGPYKQAKDVGLYLKMY